MSEEKWALVVEDDAHSLVAISSLLRDLGIRFKRNTSGASVLEQVRAMHPLPDFILLDIDLANGEAFTIQQRLLSDPALGDIPTIAIGRENGARQRVRHEGFAGYVIKPLPRHQFGDLLRRILAGEQIWEAAI